MRHEAVHSRRFFHIFQVNYPPHCVYPTPPSSLRRGAPRTTGKSGAHTKQKARTASKWRCAAGARDPLALAPPRTYSSGVYSIETARIDSVVPAAPEVAERNPDNTAAAQRHLRPRPRSPANSLPADGHALSRLGERQGGCASVGV
eukprot:3648951-Prymnesium_polylepis.1